MAGILFCNKMGYMFTPLRVVIALEVVGVAGMALGFLPREAALFLLGIFAYFTLFAPRKDAILFTVFSIPLYTALPITYGFDTMAGWRMIIALLFLRMFLQSSKVLSFGSFSPRQRGAPRLGLFRSAAGGDHAETALKPAKRKYLGALSSRLDLLVGLFFAVGALSLLVAQEPTFGIRKLLFLVNIFLLFFVIYAVIKNKQDWLDILKYTFGGALLTLAVGYAQLISVFFAPLHHFWMWWVNHVIPVFYGTGLANLLSYSNTWFSYYEGSEPTLRIFSLFPDSHSFALAMVLLLPMALTYYFINKKRPDPSKSEWVYEIVIVMALLAIIFSGTRGVWVGAIPVSIVLAAAFFTKNFPQNLRQFAKVGLVVLFVFILLFPVAAQIQKIAQRSQGGRVSDTTTFSRISTSFRTGEMSNKGRIQIWKSTIQSVVRHPLLGVGIGNYPVVLSENISATKKGASAHSLYLDFIAEIGILGGIVVLLILFEILRQALRVFSQSKDLIFGAFAGFFAIFLLWVMAYSIVDVVLLNDKVLLLFVTLTTLLYAVPKIKAPDKSEA